MPLHGTPIDLSGRLASKAASPRYLILKRIETQPWRSNQQGISDSEKLDFLIVLLLLKLGRIF